MPSSTRLVFSSHIVVVFFPSLKCDLFEEAAFFWSSIFNVDLLTLNDHLPEGVKAHFWHYLWSAYAVQNYGRNCPGIPIRYSRKIYFLPLFVEVILKFVVRVLMPPRGTCDSNQRTNWLESGYLGRRGQPGRAGPGLEMGQSQDLNRSAVLKSLVYNNDKNKLCFKWYVFTTDKEERKEEEEGEGGEKKTLELCSGEFGRGSPCLSFFFPVFSSLDLSLLGCKMGTIAVALLRCSIYLTGFLWRPKDKN